MRSNRLIAKLKTTNFDRPVARLNRAQFLFSLIIQPSNKYQQFFSVTRLLERERGQVCRSPAHNGGPHKILRGVMVCFRIFLLNNEMTQTFDEQNLADTLVDEHVFYLWALPENKISLWDIFRQKCQWRYQRPPSGSVSLEWQNSKVIQSFLSHKELHETL